MPSLSFLCQTALPTGHIALYTIDLREPPDGIDCLSPDERTRLAAFRNAAAAARYCAAHIGLRRVLAEATGAAPRELVFSHGSHGKPQLAGGPCFSLSYRGDFALVALAALPVGVDIERIGAAGGQEDSVAALAMGAREQRLAEGALGFYPLWTAKEAILKAAGTGFTLDPKAVDVSAALLSAGRQPALVGACPYWLLRVPAPYGYVATVACAQPVRALLTRRRQPRNPQSSRACHPPHA